MAALLNVLPLCFHLVLLFGCELLLNYSLVTAQRGLEEAEALLKWKSSLLPQPLLLRSWTSQINGSGNLGNHCNWFGVSCNREGRVNKIDLNGSSLQGNLDQLNFTAFKKLFYFDPSFNNLSGAIPASMANMNQIRVTFLATLSVEN